MGFQESAPFGADTAGNIFNTFISTDSEPVPSASQLSEAVISHDESEISSSLPPPCPLSDTPQVPIAIVGMGCRLPGGNSSPSKLWDFLCSSKSSWTPKAPRDRFNWDAFTHPTDPDFDGTFQIAGGHSHGEDVDLSRFDSAFFGLPLSEARILDPQQRLLLEVSYECLENGGIPMEAIAGRKIGCFVAFSMGEYGKLWDKDLEYHQNYHAVGTGEAIYANRISHVYDLAGPSMAFDTGCSGSMVGLDIACRYLSAGLIEGCFVGGTNLTLIPEVLGRKPRLLSKSGQCHTFDSLADGFSRADATSVVYLKRLDDAVRDGDPIRAVVRGTSNGFDGRTPGILMPSKEAQVANMLQAYANAGISREEFGQTAYFECHGTGTPTGDPIEVDAIGKVFAKHKSVDVPLLIGSAKTNLGHSEAASALTHIIKTSLILDSGVIPPTIGIQKFNPAIDFHNGRIKVVQELMPLPEKTRKRISIQAFGYGGANSHTILESAEDYLTQQQQETCTYKYSTGRLAQLHGSSEEESQDAASRPYLMLLSANDAHSLAENAQSLQKHVKDASQISRLDLSYTLGVRRSKLFHRGFSILSAGAPLESAFSQDSLSSAKREHMEPPRVGFIFTGQGAQRPGMGATLIRDFPSVRATLGRLDTYLAALPPQNRPDWTFASELVKPEGETRIHDPRFAQPLTCAVQIAVVNLLNQWGVKPDAGVVGHSSGEIPAAYAAGMLSERQAITVAYFRGFSITSTLEKNDTLWADAGMLAVGLGSEEALKRVKQLESQSSSPRDLVVACDNSPDSVTISGATSGLDALATKLVAEGTFARKLKVPKAYHNPHYMGRYSHIFKDALEASGTFSPKGQTHAETAPMYSSTMRGVKVHGSDVRDPEYWRRNMEGTVLFNDALTAMLSKPQHASTRPQVLIEIGPSSTLKGPVRQILTSFTSSGTLKPEEVPRYIPTLIGGSDASEDVLKTAGNLFTLGFPVDMAKVNALETISPTGSVTHTHGRMIVDLPNYAWNKSRALWHEPRASRNHRFKQFRRHEILGSRVPDDNPLVPTWRNFLSLSNTKWLADHKLNDDVVFPAAGYIAMAIEAVRQISSTAPQGNEATAFELRNIHIKSALVLNAAANAEGGVYTFLTLTRASSESKWYSFSICSQQPAPGDRRPGPLSKEESKTDVHCYGEIAGVPRRGAEPSPDPDIARIRRESGGWTGSQASTRVWYRNFSRIGYNYTNSFQVLSSLRAPAVESQAWDTRPSAEAVIALPAAETLRSHYAPGGLHNLAVPTKIDGLYVAAPEPESANLRCSSYIIPEVQDSEASKDGILGSAEAVDERTGQLVIALDKLACTNINQGQDGRGDFTEVHKVVWKPDVSSLGQLEIGAEDGPFMDVVFDLLAHQNPSAKWLEIGDAGGLVTSEALKTLAPKDGFPRLNSYTLSGHHDNSLGPELEETFQKEFPAANVSYKTLNLDDMHSAEPEYDLVVAQDVSFREGERDWIQGAITVLKPNGRLVLLLEKLGEAELSSLPFGLSRADSGLVLEADISTKSFLDGETQKKFSRVLVLKSVEESLNKPLDEDNLSSPVTIQCADAILFLGGLFNAELLASISEDTRAIIKSLISEGTEKSKPVIWLTQGSQMDAKGDSRVANRVGGAMAAGLSRTLAKEEPDLALLTVDLDGIHGSDEREFAIRDGVVYVNRIVPDLGTFDELHPVPLKQGQDQDGLQLQHENQDKQDEWKLQIRQVGLLQTLSFAQVPPVELSQPLDPSEVEVSMRAVGVNFKDVAICMGILPHKNFGLEFAGVVTRVGAAVSHLRPGQRVGGLPSLHHGAYRSLIRAPGWLCFEIPDAMSFEEAATMPCVYFTVIHSLIQKANMRRGQSILIHSGAGGVGLAAIQVARHLGAGEIYVTCGSEEKRRHLVEVEGVAPGNIFSSRSDDFVRGVARATGGRGVDVVLNSLSGDLLDASWGCVAEGGCVVDVSRVDFLRRNRLHMRPFCRSTSFHGVDASQVMTHEVVAGEVMRILAELAAAGRVRPISPMQTFGLDEVEAAFRLMQSGRSMGKLVVSRQAGDGCAQGVDRMDAKIHVQPSRKGDLLTLPAEATYVLIGCLGGIGRSITRSMFDRGARSFVMLSPSGDDRPAAKELVAFLRRNDAEVTVVRGDVGRMEDVSAAMAAAPRGRPVRGIVHSAMVLRDAPFAGSTPADFNAVAGPKVHGAHNLHIASLGLADPRTVDFFVMLSSVSGVAGNFGQTAYAAANSYLDALAAHRHGLGLAGTALDLGFVEDVGWATENEELNERMAAMGVLAVQVKEAELLALVELEMKRSSDRQAAASAAATAGANTGAGVDNKQRGRRRLTLSFECPAQRIFGLTSTNSTPSKSYAVPRLRALLNSGSGSGSSSASLSQSGPAAALLQHLKSSGKGKDSGASLAAVMPLAQEALLHKMSEFLLVPVDEIDAGRSPESVGVDSLVAVELRTWLRDSLGVAASTMDILKAASFRSLAETVAKRLVDKEKEKKG
ncbi:uncharacterized protein J7T55_012480 [Diaporthe amygdali]|uniref:uncharacterized protein n=1 Tax=Phomopsis amygdali TaxID=1214568 RepID=UPI0022FF4423|nr:uncharacterized protein J7T55_012480 [Diaporthe amygdali]KAJ0124007.1 uncharacterized protein J7T55_012480 [Diaporthe amygdali]